MSNELEQRVESIRREEEPIRAGGGQRAIDRQHAKGRLTARERIDRLLDPGTSFFELGLWAAWGMYREWGGAPAAGVVTGIGTRLRPAASCSSPTTPPSRPAPSSP